MNVLKAARRRFRSIRWRVVSSYLLITLLVVMIIGMLTLALVESFARQRERDYMFEQAVSVSKQARLLLFPNMQSEAVSDLAHTTAARANVRVTIWNAEGELVVDASPAAQQSVWVILSGEDGAGPKPHQVVVGTALPEGMPAPVDVSVAPLRFKEHIRLPIGPAGAPLGYVEVGEGPDMVSPALGTARAALLPAALAAVAVAVGLALLTGHRLASPLEDLTRAAERMSGGDLSIRAPEYRQGEVGDLARQFNAMAVRLEASFADLAAERDTLRTFIADASHELRTPITALRTFNELLQDGADDDPQARDDFLRESQAQIERLAWITHNLLDLSRLDAGLVSLDLAPCSVAQLIEAAVAAFQSRAAARGLAFVLLPSAPDLTLVCDRARIEISLCNLLDNAFKYTPPGGVVTVGGQRQGDEILLWVADTGPGVAREDVPHLFHRFSRASRDDGEGSGLGLAIARRLVEAHGGRVDFEGEQGQGSRFILALPA